MSSERARLARVGIEAAPDFEARIDELLECLIIQGQARYRLAPVLPEPACTPVRLNEAARRMAELTREDADAFVFNHWHELLPCLRWTATSYRYWTAAAIAMPWSKP